MHSFGDHCLLFYVVYDSAYEGDKLVEDFSEEQLQVAADSIRFSVQRKLRSGSAAPESIACRRGVLFLWFGKGGEQKRRKYHLQKEDFPAKLFPPGWDTVMDRHGQGQRVYYPITVGLTVRRSPKNFRRNPSGELVECQQSTEQYISVQFTGVQSHV